METQQIVANLVGALIFAVPITARAYYKRSSSEAAKNNAIAKSYEKLEARCVAAETKSAELAKSIVMLEAQNDSNNELIAAFSEQKTKDDGIIRGLKAQLKDQESIIKTVEGRR